MSEQPYRTTIVKLGPPVRDRLEAAIRSAVPSVAPALALSVWHSGSPWFCAYAGWTDPDHPDTPVTTRTLFDLASLTKLFTATALLRLASDGRIGLDDPVVSVIPEFGAGGPRGVDGGQDPLSRRMLPVPPDRAAWTVDPAAVTFRQLLTHTGGLAPWRSVFRDGGLEAVYGYPFVARPGTEFHYSDLGFMLLGEAVARRFRAPLEVAVQALVRDRLGLDSLTYAPSRTGRPQHDIAPTSIDDDWRGRRCWGEADDENAASLDGVAGHAGLFATADDVARFGVAWLRRDPRLRLPAYWSTATSDQTPGLGAARGLGWQVAPAEQLAPADATASAGAPVPAGAVASAGGTVPGDHLAPFGAGAYGHTGFTGTSLAVDPRRDLVVALLTNRGYSGRTHEGIEELRLRVHALIAEAFE